MRSLAPGAIWHAIGIILIALGLFMVAFAPLGHHLFKGAYYGLLAIGAGLLTFWLGSWVAGE